MKVQSLCLMPQSGMEMYGHLINADDTRAHVSSIATSHKYEHLDTVLCCGPGVCTHRDARCA